MLNSAYALLSGGGRWHTLPQCLSYDFPMILLITALNCAVGICLFVIAAYWRKCAKMGKTSVATKALNDLSCIFINCATTGHVFAIINLVWPAWWLWVAFMCVLLFHCLRFVGKTVNGMVIVYQDLQTINEMRDHLKCAEFAKTEVVQLRETLEDVQRMLLKS